jgi:hypothetical protein
MQIQRTPEIERFFQRCMNNMRNENKNWFLDAKVTTKNENIYNVR